MKIGQLSKVVGLSTHTIRYYEKLGLLPQPQKDPSGHRFYDVKDIELINWVTCLKKSGMSLERIKIYNSAFKDHDKKQLIELLSLHLNRLKEQQIDLQHYIEVTENKLKNLNSS